MNKRISLFLIFSLLISLVGIMTASAWTDGPVITTYTASSDDDGYEADLAFDNDDISMWHTQWNDYGEGTAADIFPQSVIVEFDNNYWIDCVGYLPRQDGSANGSALSYEVWVTLTGSANDHTTDEGWTKVASGTWEEDFWMDWRDEATGAFQNIEFDAIEVKLVKFVILDGIGGWSSAAELEFGFLGVNYAPQAGFTPKSAPGTAAPAPEPEPEPEPAAAVEEAAAPVAVEAAPAPVAVAVPQTGSASIVLMFAVLAVAIIVTTRVNVKKNNI